MKVIKKGKNIKGSKKPVVKPNPKQKLAKPSRREYSGDESSSSYGYGGWGHDE